MVIIEHLRLVVLLLQLQDHWHRGHAPPHECLPFGASVSAAWSSAPTSSSSQNHMVAYLLARLHSQHTLTSWGIVFHRYTNFGGNWTFLHCPRLIPAALGPFLLPIAWPTSVCVRELVNAPLLLPCLGSDSRHQLGLLVLLNLYPLTSRLALRWPHPAHVLSQMPQPEPKLLANLILVLSLDFVRHRFAHSRLWMRSLFCQQVPSGCQMDGLMTTTLHQKMIKTHHFLSQACRPSSATSLNLAWGAAPAADLLLR